ncbi:MAG: hypothetical protein IPO91_02090 [Chloroflexi bacterium]|nr:hypothetical protein [Chloroflexota bacterium]
MTLKLSTPHFISKVSALFQLDRRDYVWLGVLIALAIIVQGGMLRLQFSTPDGDFVGHVRIARRIVEEGVLEGPHIVYHVIVNTLTLVIGDRTTAGLLVVLAAQVVLLPIIYGLLRPVMANTKLIISAVIVPTVLLLIAQYALGFSDAEAGIAVAPFSVVGHLTGYGVP